MHIHDFLGERGASVKGLCEAYLAGAPPHAALLLGAEGTGKRTLAETLAQSLYCTGHEPKPCGACAPCRRYLSGSHPDAYRLRAKKRIGVDEIREMITALAQAPYEGGWRTVIIESAGAMTPQAQNSLLKTLEEPPDRTAFLLTAVSAAQLLPTIRSRCRIVQVPPMAPDVIAQRLTARGIAAERARELAALCGGSIGRALALDGDEGFFQLRSRLYGALDAVRGPGDVLGALSAIRDDKQDAERACSLIEMAIESALVSSVSGLAPAQGWPLTLSKMEPWRLTRLYGHLITVRKMLASNVSWQAAIERFILEYAEEYSTWQS